MKRIGLGLAFAVFVLIFSTEAMAGSLWMERERMGKGSMFVDRRARRIGDILTIVITETSTAETDADTKTKRESTIKDEVKSWIKVVLNSLGILPDIKAYSVPTTNLPKIDTTASHEYKSKGKTTRSQKFVAKMSAKIIDILPNGIFVIEGQKEIEINGERQYVTLTGEVRPEDITADNTVESSRIANAKISCKGLGTIGDKQNSKGLLEWFFDLAWLF